MGFLPCKRALPPHGKTGEKSDGENIFFNYRKEGLPPVGNVPYISPLHKKSQNLPFLSFIYFLSLFNILIIINYIYYT